MLHEELQHNGFLRNHIGPAGNSGALCEPEVNPVKGVARLCYQ